MTEQKKNQVTSLKKIQEETVNQIMEIVEAQQASGELVLPDKYVPGNALKLAWLHLQDVKTKEKKPVLEVCTKVSICNALLKMVLQGMNVSKDHGAFIAYGNQLSWQKMVAGNMMLAKRDAGVVDVNPQIIYEGDKYVTKVNERGIRELVEHDSPIENQDPDKIKGGYAVAYFKDGTTKLTQMTFGQIRQAWLMGGELTKAHKNFPDQMAEKTLINRACKREIASTDDTELLERLPDSSPPAMEARDKAIGEKKERRVLAFTDAEEVTDEPKKQPEPEKEKAKAEKPKQEEAQEPVESFGDDMESYVQDDMADQGKPKEGRQRMPDF